MVINLCERCYYDEADPEASVADIWAHFYDALCTHCATAGHKAQAKAEMDL